MIPQSAWSPVAVATLKFLPTPTGVDSVTGHPFFATAAHNSNLRDDKFGIKVDFDWRRQLVILLSLDDADFLNPYPAFTSNVPGFSATSVSRAQQFVINHTALLGPNAVNEAHVGYTRFAFLNNKPVEGWEKSQISDMSLVGSE